MTWNNKTGSLYIQCFVLLRFEGRWQCFGTLRECGFLLLFDLLFSLGLREDGNALEH